MTDITFTTTELRALDLCLNAAGNGDHWSEMQVDVSLRLGIHSATTKISKAREIADIQPWAPPNTRPCVHARVTKPFYGGGNYGHYGTQRCLDCGATRDSWSDWSVGNGATE